MSDYVTEWESGRPETECGKGSRVAETVIIRNWLPSIVEKYDIYSIADIGCGDQNWIHMVDWPYEIEYKGYDVKPRNEEVHRLDIVEQTPPSADLMLCIYVLNHLSPKQMRRALFNLQASGAPYLLTSYCTFDKIPLTLLEHIHHKDTGRHTWNYGLWALNLDLIR